MNSARCHGDDDDGLVAYEAEEVAVDPSDEGRNTLRTEGDSELPAAKKEGRSVQSESVRKVQRQSVRWPQ
ncbi:hypothetical protein J6590_042950 [Homalodisca vitripennis]|nr:hypothetical protein J6590_042950 [Homalodisca vitripennis]